MHPSVIPLPPPAHTCALADNYCTVNHNTSCPPSVGGQAAGMLVVESSYKGRRFAGNWDLFSAHGETGSSCLFWENMLKYARCSPKHT